MPTLSAISGELRTVTVELYGVTLTALYRPSAVTPRLQRQVTAAQARGDLDGAVLDPICAVIARWDLTDDDGAPVPLTPAGVETVPMPALTALMDAIGADTLPNRARAGDSNNGLPAPASSAPAPSGT